MANRIECKYCINGHKYVCDCGHRHDAHNQMGGCRYSFCPCEGYSQKRKRLPEETEKQYQHRVLSIDKHDKRRQLV